MNKPTPAELEEFYNFADKKLKEAIALVEEVIEEYEKTDKSHDQYSVEVYHCSILGLAELEYATDWLYDTNQ